MKLHINKQSEVSAHEQLREQIIFLISTGALAIGDEMPGVRALSRQLRISLNTVSKVYSELARAGWLVEHAGAHHKVVDRKVSHSRSIPVTDIDAFLEGVVAVADTHGFSLEELSARLGRYVAEKPADRCLIVAPDPGLGALMRGEIGKKLGHTPAVCSLSALQQNPAIADRALLVAPMYLVELLGQLGLPTRSIVAVSYSPIDEVFQAIAGLSKPSMIGWVSVSQAGLKTMSVMAAPAIGDLHSSHLFLLEEELDSKPQRFHLRRYAMEEYKPVDILRSARRRMDSDASRSISARASGEDNALPADDLHCMDLLICDSIAASLIQHPRSVRYQLLTNESLDRIEIRAASLAEMRSVERQPEA